MDIVIYPHYLTIIRMSIRIHTRPHDPVIYEIANEMGIYICAETALKELPKVKKIICSLDSTRPVYFEGDSSLWDESAQDITSRHYGMEITGEGWWDKTRPLNVGEMGGKCCFREWRAGFCCKHRVCKAFKR